MLVNSRICTFCKHEYVTPCDGKNNACQNAIWIKSGKNYEKYSKLWEAATSSVKAASKSEKKGRTRL